MFVESDVLGNARLSTSARPVCPTSALRSVGLGTPGGGLVCPGGRFARLNTVSPGDRGLHAAAAAPPWMVMRELTARLNCIPVWKRGPGFRPRRKGGGKENKEEGLEAGCSPLTLPGAVWLLCSRQGGRRAPRRLSPGRSGHSRGHSCGWARGRRAVCSPPSCPP